jgi:hypothetical protein
MSLLTIVSIALVCAAAAAVNGIVGAIFLSIIWIWLSGGVLPMVYPWLKRSAEFTWVPQLLLPLIVFLLIWQWRLRGRIGPSWGLRQFIRDRLGRRGPGQSFA